MGTCPDHSSSPLLPVAGRLQGTRSRQIRGYGRIAFERERKRALQAVPPFEWQKHERETKVSGAQVLVVRECPGEKEWGGLVRGESGL